MTKAFKSAASFKMSLEERLRRRATISGVPFHTQQLKFAMERLLARLFYDADAPWLLKGGFAMDLRYRPRARSTRDIDLSVTLLVVGSIADLRDKIQAAAEIDLGDFLTFYIGELTSEIANAPKGGGRLPVEAVLVGKTYARFSIDVGIGDPLLGEPELLTGDDVLEFAGISTAVARAIPKAQQFAEKLHAYTFPWSDRINTRTKDLVDLVLLIERGALDLTQLRIALSVAFSTRGTHLLPKMLPPPPTRWRVDFPEMASEAGLSTTNIVAAFAALEAFWNSNSLGES
ncbi:MAG: hypothetical protein RIS36_793 [Pseudomonadota bacterium]